ncbi:MAG: glycosyltransferase family 39 protein [Pseudomonadota bacterium]
MKRVRDRLPETSALVLGILLRISMATTYDVNRGFDFVAHWLCADYIARHAALPPLDLTAAAYHPPLYYFVLAAMIKAGLGTGAAGWLAAVLGIARLVVVWVALERWLPESRLARVVALFTAAVIPVGVQLDGMVTNETASTLLCALAMLAAPSAIEAAREGRVRPVAWLALWLGLALLTKFSISVMLVAVALAVALEIARSPQPWPEALRSRSKPLAVGALIIVGLSGWFYARNEKLYGMVAPTGYEGLVKASQAPYEKIPYLERRTPDFLFAWDPDVFGHPYVPSGTRPRARFFSVLVASTFSDYYSYGLAGWQDGDRLEQIAYRPVPTLAYDLSRLSVIGGTFIAALTVLAWFGALEALRARPQDPRAVLLFLPLLALLGQIHFAIKYPNDNFGPIKGAYLQFVTPILSALFGIAVAWTWRHIRARAGAVAALASLLFVAVYIVDCRWPRFGPGASRAAPLFAQGPIAR